MIKPHYTHRETGTANALWRWLPAISCILSTVVFEMPAQASGRSSLPPPGAQVMSAVELYMLYRNKSWQWPDGSGRMQSDGRRFTAWAGSGLSSTWADGRWTVTDRGRLCFEAKWHSMSGVYPNKTCFRHKQHRGTIYQKREPSQTWYVFKDPPPTEGGEFSKLVSQDLVSSELERIRSAIEAAAPLPVAKSYRRTQ
jgi:hypothetical protein